MEAMTSEREAFEKWAAENDYALDRFGDSYQAADTRNAWWGYRAALEAHLAQPAQAVDDERQWRELLAIRVAGPALYTDDGELSDATAEPYIDFKRDSADTIARKLADRTRALSGEKAGPVGDGWQPTDDDVRAWVGRNDITGLSLYDCRSAIEDARMMHNFDVSLPASPTPDKEGEG